MSYSFSSYRPAAELQVARQAFLLRERMDLLLCTGDLATTGRESDLRVAERFFTSSAYSKYVDRNYRPTVTGTGRPIFVMPGNHDRYGRLGLPGGRTFDLVFSRKWGTQGTEKVQHAIIGKGDAKLCIIAADFCLKPSAGTSGPQNYLGQGRCYDDVLTALVSLTTEVKERHRSSAMIWAIHFPPHSDTDRRMRLVNGNRVLSAAEDCGVPVVLCGHLHEKSSTPTNFGLILGGGTCCAVDVEGAYCMHFLEIETDAARILRVKRQDYAWSQKTRMFMIEEDQDFLFS